MGGDIPKVNVAAQDRILLHLLNHYDWADRYVVPQTMTRPGIAEACAQHPPNVSRTMRNLLKDGMVEEHTRSIQGVERRQKTWQLTEDGKALGEQRHNVLNQTKILIRNVDGELLELKAEEAGSHLQTELTLLQILLHAQHEGVLTYGDIRFGNIRRADDDVFPAPGRLMPLVGVHATYATAPPVTRPVYGRDEELKLLHTWFDDRRPCMVVHGIAGIGKSTLVAHWLEQHMEQHQNLSVCWYPCQPWDQALGLATSLLHRFGIDESHDPYRLIETLPLTPGAEMDVDAWRRRLLAYLTDASTIRERFKDRAGGPPPYWLIVLDDIHHVSKEASHLLGALLQIAQKAPLRMVFISRTTLNVYDRRDVHIRDNVRELPLSGLSLEATEAWISALDVEQNTPIPEVHAATGGHPLALELLEIYGQPTHRDWLRFLDEEILARLPGPELELLSTLAVAESPVKWEVLADSTGWNGAPPENLLQHGLLLELEQGMWLHDALKERLLRDVGENKAARKAKLG
tara:strand:- start:4200 stop:5750 length:1551 start_codon:yes stop_codon:yes gene_type:complete